MTGMSTMRAGGEWLVHATRSMFYLYGPQALALDHTDPASDFDHNTGDPLIRDMSNHYRNPTHSNGPYRDWTGSNGQEMGVGGVYYELAGTMVPSLTGFEPPYTLPI